MPGTKVGDVQDLYIETLGTQQEHAQTSFTQNNLTDGNLLNEPRNSDIYDLLSALCRFVESNRAYMTSEFQRIDRQLSAIEKHLSLLVSAIAIHLVLKNNIMADTNTGEFTRTVMYRVPTIVLCLLWTNYRPDKGLLVSTKFLDKLFGALVDTYNILVRRELGVAFSVVLKSESGVNIQGISQLLSDSTSIYSSAMRKNIHDVYTLCSTSYAFMIPIALCEFMHSIGEISNTGILDFSDILINKKSSCVRASEVYVTGGSDFCVSPTVLNVIKSGKCRTSKKYLSGLAVKLKTGQAPTLDECHNLGFQADEDITSIFQGTTSASSPTPHVDDRLSDISSIQSDSLSRVSIRGSPAAKSMFQHKKSD